MVLVKENIKTYSSTPYGRMRDRIDAKEKKENNKPKRKIGFYFRY